MLCPTMIKDLIQNAFFHLLKLGYLALDLLFQGLDSLMSTVKVICNFFLLLKVWLAVAEGN